MFRGLGCISAFAILLSLSASVPNVIFFPLCASFSLSVCSSLPIDSSCSFSRR